MITFSTVGIAGRTVGPHWAAAYEWASANQMDQLNVLDVKIEYLTIFWLMSMERSCHCFAPVVWTPLHGSDMPYRWFSALCGLCVTLGQASMIAQVIRQAPPLGLLSVVLFNHWLNDFALTKFNAPADYLGPRRDLLYVIAGPRIQRLVHFKQSRICAEEARSPGLTLCCCKVLHISVGICQ